MDEDVLSDVVPSNIVSRQVRASGDLTIRRVDLLYRSLDIGE